MLSSGVRAGAAIAPVGAGARQEDGLAGRGGRGAVGWIVRNPLLTVALFALVVRFGLPLVSDGFDQGIPGLIWAGAVFLVRPFSLIATWMDPHFRGLPEFVDLVGTLLLGLLPYAAVDVAHRRWALRSRR